MRARVLRDFHHGCLVAVLLVGVWVMPSAGAERLGLADATAASESAAMTAVLDTVVVHGRGLSERSLPVATGVVTVVDLDGERGGADLGELLARVAGLQVRRYGGLGAQAVPSIRGCSGAQVQVLVDGLPLADAQNGAIDISLLPLERYATAEIHRGLMPAGFGGIGGAGAVNLTTRQTADGTGARLFTGSFGDLGGRVHHGLSSANGARRMLVMVHGRRLDNRFEFEPRIPAAQIDLYPDTTWTRDNADLEEWGWLVSGELTGGAGLLRASAGRYRRDGGRPGPFNLPSPHARVRHERLDARLGAVTADGDWSADVSFAQDDGRLIDDHREVGLDPAGTNVTRSEDLLARAIWSPLWSLGPLDLGLVAGADGRLQWYRESIAGDEQSRRNRRTVSTFASGSLDVPRWRLGVMPQWRWQRQRDDFPPVPNLPWMPEETGIEHEQDAVSPALNIIWEPWEGQLIVQLHWHETVRQPTWVELFGQPGGLVGNRELRPEEITGRDVGVRWRIPGVDGVVRATWFDQVTERSILWYVSGLGQSKPYNVGRTRSQGVELEGALDHGPLELSLAATYQDAHHGHGLDPVYHGKQLPFLSDWTVFTHLGLRLGAWRPGLALRHESQSYTDLYNDPDARVAPRTGVDLSLSHVVDGGIWGKDRRATVTAEVINVTDQQLHDVEGYPLPGRSLRLSLHWQ